MTETIARPTETALAALPLRTCLRTGEWTATKTGDDLWQLTGVGGNAATTNRGAALTLRRNAAVHRPA